MVPSFGPVWIEVVSVTDPFTVGMGKTVSAPSTRRSIPATSPPPLA